MFTTVAAGNSNRIAIVEGEAAVTYGQLEKRILAFAAQLYDAGVRPGDRVAMLLPNGSTFITNYFAALSLGAIVVPLNDQYQETELSRFLKETGASYIITSQSFGGLCQEVLRLHETSCRILFVENHTHASASGTSADFRVKTDPDAPVMYQFSSGSTGRPKRISRTHRNLLFELNSLKQTLELTHEDQFLGVTPFSHVNGLMRSMMASIRAGATLYPAAKFDRQAVANMIEKHKISVFVGVPFMFGVLAKTNFPRQPDFSSLRLCISASAPLPAKLNRQFHDRFGLYVRQLYGSTETGTISVDLSANIEKSLESVGHPIAGVHVEVYDETGRPAGINDIGEVAVRSPAAIARYDGSDAPNQESFRNGYFFTGDLGRKDENGLLYLVGRKKLFINKGGYKINPREIEELLESYPKVEEAVVVGLPTSFGDERLKAMIVLNGSCTEEEIIEHCRGKIADFKVPSLIEFRERFPKSPTGKIRRELLASGKV
ncbi:MAG: class I adenylate-forming enzyme family protein [Candidatus Binatia bacterium]